MAAAVEGWKRGGLIRGRGIPAPSGQYPVGCAHLMHKFEDDTDTLLVRLFYPCQEGGGRRLYTQWAPHKRYIKSYLEYSKVKAAGFVSTVVGWLTGKLTEITTKFKVTVRSSTTFSSAHNFH